MNSHPKKTLSCCKFDFAKMCKYMEITSKEYLQEQCDRKGSNCSSYKCISSYNNNNTSCSSSSDSINNDSISSNRQ